MRSRYHALIPSMTRNLRSLYLQSVDADIISGSRWYDDAHRIMCEWSETYGYSIAVCAAVTAALSPQCEWTRNLIIADDILAGRIPSIGALASNVRHAQTLRDAHESDTRTVFKRGPKVYAFSRNLAGDYLTVTVDTHALQAALHDVRATVSLKEPAYSCFQSAYADAAASFSYEPAVFQAIIWHVWKRLYPRMTKNLLRRKDRR